MVLVYLDFIISSSPLSVDYYYPILFSLCSITLKKIIVPMRVVLCLVN